MNQRTVTIRSGLRLATLVVAAMVLGGCSTYYQSYYPDSGVYYGDSGVYGHSPGYSRSGYGPVNPAVYPYWSIDYFYFSQYYHPYSVFVGYHEPLYYPYPGWAFGHYRPARAYGSLAFGFGYPWHGFGYRYPAYTFGFFSSYDPYYHGGYYRGDRYGHDRIRRIDRRLESLRHGESYASRRELLGRDRIARNVGGAPYDNRGNGRSAAQSQSQSQSRADLLRQRNAANSRALRNRTFAPDRRIQRRAPDVRLERQPDRRVLDRDRIRRDGGRSAYEGERGIPIDNVRGRVIVDSRDRRAGGTGSRDQAASRSIRRAPATDWGRSERSSRRSSGQAWGQSRGGGDPARGNLLNRSSRSSGAPSRPVRNAAPPPRPARNVSRPEPPSRASSAPSRRATLRDRSGDGGRSNRRR